MSSGNVVTSCAELQRAGTVSPGSVLWHLMTFIGKDVTYMVVAYVGLRENYSRILARLFQTC